MSTLLSSLALSLSLCFLELPTYRQPTSNSLKSFLFHGMSMSAFCTDDPQVHGNHARWKPLTAKAIKSSVPMPQDCERDYLPVSSNSTFKGSKQKTSKWQPKKHTGTEDSLSSPSFHHSSTTPENHDHNLHHIEYQFLDLLPLEYTEEPSSSSSQNHHLHHHRTIIVFITSLLTYSETHTT
jgi:hypothetical protein